MAREGQDIPIPRLEKKRNNMPDMPDIGCLPMLCSVGIFLEK
jgi:hypothetical protein